MYIATDLGVWFTNNDDGVNWTILGVNLPTTIVADIKIHEPTNVLYAGTFGRSMYSYDLNDVAAINNVNFENDIVVYPNPIKNQSIVAFNLQQTSTTKIYITDLLGKKVLEIKNEKLQSGQQKIQISNTLGLKGIHFLHIQTANKHLTKKVIFS